MPFVCMDGGQLPTYLEPWPTIEFYTDLHDVSSATHLDGISAAAYRSFRSTLAKTLRERRFEDADVARINSAAALVMEPGHVKLGGDLNLMLRQDVAHLRIDLVKNTVLPGSREQLTLEKYFRIMWIAASPAVL